MTSDLDRISEEPDCEYPGCLLIGRTRTWLRVLGEHRILCSIHDHWDGAPPPIGDGFAAFKAARESVRGES